MVKEVEKEERRDYITGALSLSKEKIEGGIDAYRRGNYGQVLSSLYYGYFHLVKALLYQKGFDPKSHEGVYSMLNLHFITFFFILWLFSSRQSPPVPERV